MKTLHTYSRDIILDAEYTYNKENKKVYNIKKLKRHFKNVIEKLK